MRSQRSSPPPLLPEGAPPPGPPPPLRTRRVAPGGPHNGRLEQQRSEKQTLPIFCQMALAFVFFFTKKTNQRGKDWVGGVHKLRVNCPSGPPEHDPRLPLQRHLLHVARQPIEIRPEMAGEALRRFPPTAQCKPTSHRRMPPPTTLAHRHAERHRGRNALNLCSTIIDGVNMMHCYPSR